MAQEDLTCPGETHASRCPHEERRAELTFQHPDLTAHRRLGDSKLAGGAPDVTFLGDGNEVLDLREAHDTSVADSLTVSAAASGSARDQNGIGLAG